MSLDWLPPILILCHPEYEPIRYKLLCDHLPKHGIPLDKVRWIRGPWGSTLTSEQFFACYDPFRPRLSSELAMCFKSAGLLRGEVSLILTFREAVSQALALNTETVLIFESDIVLREDFVPRLQRLLDQATNRNDWDYISLGEGVGTRPEGHSFSYFTNTELYDPKTPWAFRCTDSMVFRRRFLAVLHHTLREFRECLDWELNAHLQATGAKALWADPPLVEPGSGRWRFLSLLPG